MKSKFNFTFPDIVAQGFQDIRGHVFTIMPHWAYGEFRVAPVSKWIYNSFVYICSDKSIIWIDVRFFGECKMSVNREGFLNMDRISAEMYMDEFNSKMDNLLTGGDFSDLLNQVIPDIVPSAFDNFPEKVTDRLQKKVLPTANKILNTINIKDIMQTYNMKNFN